MSQETTKGLDANCGGKLRREHEKPSFNKIEMLPAFRNDHYKQGWPRKNKSPI